MWLRLGYLFPETEAFIIAIQDQVIATRNYKKYVMKEHIPTDKCRMCGEQTESIDHIISGCQTLAPKEYTKRHDNIGKVIHQELLKLHNTDTEETIPYYKYNPESVLETENFKMYWNREIITDLPMQHNKPDVVFTDKKAKHTYLIDFSVPLAANLQKKYKEKLVNTYLWLMK